MEGSEVEAYADAELQRNADAAPREVFASPGISNPSVHFAPHGEGTVMVQASKVIASAAAP